MTLLLTALQAYAAMNNTVSRNSEGRLQWNG
jgi:hypothetical protein